MKVKVFFTRATQNYLCYENEDMDFRDGAMKVKVWMPKKEIEPEHYVPPALEILVSPPTEAA